MSKCVLSEIKKRINAGMDPDKAIPWEISVSSLQEYLEVLNYAAQVLPDGFRKDTVKKKLEEVIADVRRSESIL